MSQPPGAVDSERGERPVAAARSRRWIAAAVGAFLLGAGWIAVVLFLQHHANVVLRARLSALELRVAELEARRGEKDFLQRSLVDGAFYTTGKSEFLDHQRRAVRNVEDACNHLFSLLPVEEHSKVFGIREQVRRYAAEFESMVETLRALGAPGHGQEALLENAIVEIETIVFESGGPRLAEACVQLRRATVPFFRRRDRGSEEAVAGALHRLRAQAGESASAPALESGVAVCESALQSYGALLDKAGRTENEGAQRRLRDAIHQIEPAIAALVTASEVADRSAQRNLRLGLIVSGCWMTALFMASVLFAERASTRSAALQRANQQMLVDMEARRQMLETIAEKHRQLLQAERLAAIGQTVTGLAHESRNALQRSQACLEMLRHQVESPRGRELVERIQDAQNHLQHLYEEVRSYAAPLHLELRSCLPPEAAQKAWDSLSLEREGRDASFTQVSPPAVPELQLDPYAMEQVFRNILENSLAACADPVRVDVTWSAMQAAGQQRLVAVVKDNGPGLTAEARDRVFEPFFTTKTRGTGLGMAIARRIVQAHGGEIRIGESPGGAEFQISLPLTSAA